MNPIGKILGTSIAGVAIAIAGCGKQSQDYPLAHLGHVNAPKIAMFDRNNDQVLSPEEADEYARTIFFKNPDKPTLEEIGNLIDVIKKITEYPDETPLPKNIRITCNNLIDIVQKHLNQITKELISKTEQSLGEE